MLIHHILLQAPVRPILAGVAVFGERSSPRQWALDTSRVAPAFPPVSAGRRIGRCCYKRPAAARRARLGHGTAAGRTVSKDAGPPSPRP